MKSQLTVKFESEDAVKLAEKNIENQKNNVFDMVSEIEVSGNKMILTVDADNAEEARHLVWPHLVISANYYGYEIELI